MTHTLPEMPQVQFSSRTVMMNGRDRLHNHRRLKYLRRTLRRNLTPAEAALWNCLKHRQLDGYKFRRQHSVGPYIVDFYCAARKLAIELDGAGHEDPMRKEYDHERQEYLRDHGIRVMRFENFLVFERRGLVLESIRRALSDRPSGSVP